jgi:hypothetical protein
MTPEDFSRLKTLTDRIGLDYGTEDFALMLYALVKMRRPEVILELGTGHGGAAFWMAQAAKENGIGKVWTIDDGSLWPTTFEQPGHRFTAEEWCPDQRDYMAAMTTQLGLSEQIRFIAASIPPFPPVKARIDLLFSDFRHGPEIVIKLFAHFLPMMADASIMLIDSAPTLLSSRLLLERLVADFNKGHIPPLLEDLIDETQRAQAWALVRRCRFTLLDVMERKDRAQNSTAWIQIAPDDLMPHPATSFRFM